MKVPTAFAHWEPHLRIFPAEIGVALAPMAHRISALVGSFSGKHTEGRIEPDGFGGLEKRGEYHRLVISDWALADEFPEEFMRRSVMGEHLFWKIAHRDLTQSRGAWVIFDAGPEQLGSPRLAHIAALLAFRARSEAARASFGWGILQAPERDVLPASNESEVRVLLMARGSMSATREHLEAWAKKASEQGINELWVVGARRLSGLLSSVPMHALFVSDVLVPGERRLSLECQPLGQHARTVELELPPSGVCAQVLRDPFHSAAARAHAQEQDFSPQHLLLSMSGRVLYTLAAHDTLMAIPVPNSPSAAPPGRIKFYRSSNHQPIIAAGKFRKSMVLISRWPTAESGLHVDLIGKKLPLSAGQYTHVPVAPMFFSDCRRLRPCAATTGAESKIAIVDNRGMLIELSETKAGRQADVKRGYVLAFTQTQYGWCTASFDAESASGCPELQVFGSYRINPIQSFPLDARPVRAFFGCGSSGQNNHFGLLAVGYEASDMWEIFTHARKIPIRVPESTRVYGVVQESNHEETLVVVRDNDPGTLTLMGAHGDMTLIKESSPIVQVTGCFGVPLLAYATQDGQISVYSLHHRQKLLHHLNKPVSADWTAQ